MLRSKPMLCPYCYAAQEETWDPYAYRNFVGLWLCTSCSKVFKVALEIEVTYVTEKTR